MLIGKMYFFIVTIVETMFAFKSTNCGGFDHITARKIIEITSILFGMIAA